MDRRIDYIFIGKPARNGAGHPLKSTLVGTTPKGNMYPSDHFGVMTYLEG